MRPRQFAAAGAERHFEAQPVTRHYLPPELRIVDATEVGMARRLAIRSLHQEQRRDLRQRLNHEHARHQRRAGKVSLEEIFVDGDVLDGDEPFAGLVLGHRIDERRRVPVAQPVDGFGNVRHRPNLIRFGVRGSVVQVLGSWFKVRFADRATHVGRT